LKIFQRRITKWSKNSYPHYHCPWMRCTKSCWASDI
jgi:hypothetical protein